MDDVLAAALEVVGGRRRDGQTAMCERVASTLNTGTHLLVQAGTGTGKSLGYLCALLPLAGPDSRAIVTTATRALQRQLVTKDVPAVVEAMRSLGRRPPDVALLKGWSNYACLRKLSAPEEATTLFEMPGNHSPSSSVGRAVVRMRAWAEESPTGDRDDLSPGVSDRVWQLASISARDCPGDSCPFFSTCFPRRARRRAQAADVVVTNHALLGTDLLGDGSILGEYDYVVVDEAHELIDRIRQAAAVQLSPKAVRAVAAKVHRADQAVAADLEDAADALAEALASAEEGLITTVSPALRAAFDAIDAAVRAGGESLPRGTRASDSEKVARSRMNELSEIAGDARAAIGGDGHACWVSVDGDERRLHAAPIDIAGRLASALLSDHSAVFTSATLTLGGSFDAAAHQIGLSLSTRPWACYDAGSPFDYARQAIRYVAADLPAPTRGGIDPAVLDELCALAQASGGGVLGLFSSHRALSQAADVMRETGLDVLVQGEDQVSTLVEQFRERPDSCLLGTLSLWQGVDVPGHACRLVVIDRIPFPHPDDPLLQARERAIRERGGNPFLQISLTSAALLLAQGVGRLVRSGSDRGVVAILDSRLATARYRHFLLASLPPMWPSTSRETVVGALERLRDAAAGE